jgi:hypothetical protein
MVLAAPLVVLLYPGPQPWRQTLRTLLKAAGIAAVVTLPFAVLDPVALYNDLIGFQMRQPFRMDALSYLAWWAAGTGQQPPSWHGFAVVLPALGLSLWRAPRTPAGFAAAMAMTYTVFFAFSKQAFCNYYYFVGGMLLLLAAEELTTTPAPAAPDVPVVPGVPGVPVRPTSQPDPPAGSSHDRRLSGWSPWARAVPRPAA